MEVARAGEALADDGGTDDLPVADDELAVGLVAHGELRDSGDDQRIDDAEKNGGHDGVANGDVKSAAHVCLSLRCSGLSLQITAHSCLLRPGAGR